MGLNIICVGIGGFIGSILRYLISVNGRTVLGFIPFGTLLVNIIGGFFIGIIMDINNTYTMNSSIKLFLTTGLMGGLTTFSTFSFETISLFSQGKYIVGGLNIILNVALSLFGVILGRFLIKYLI